MLLENHIPPASRIVGRHRWKSDKPIISVDRFKNLPGDFMAGICIAFGKEDTLRDGYGDERFPDGRLHDPPLVGALARENGEGGEMLGELGCYSADGHHLHSVCMGSRPPG
ncbi:hypothetical protein [Shinella sp. BYT-45]|uniref:hypothetical protein n=1 Tax=Shinella sp. BYT-45 TaxID=3377377 RepID=UPI0039813A07